MRTQAANAADDFTAIWSRQQARNFDLNQNNTAPELDGNFPLAAPGLWIWDTWPLTNEDGDSARIHGYKFIFALTAPRSVGWNDRHNVAAIHYFYSKDGKSWEPSGLAYDPNDALGSRQWAGCATLDKSNRVHLFYTAVGRKWEQNYTFEQRIAETSFDINVDRDSVHLSNLGEHKIILEPDGRYYQTMSQARGPIIYSFRDPQFFKDPKTGRRYLLFEGNSGGDNPTVKPENIGDEQFRQTHLVPAGAEHYNGNIGIAELKDNDYRHPRLLPPLVEADGVNQQLERPHIIVRGSRYYLFTISHQFTYAPGLTGPDGLYGFIGASLRSDYQPLNGNGLVLANPAANPLQAYSWYVLKDGSVLSFINEVKQDNGEIREGGTFAPTLRLSLLGDQTTIEGQLEYGAIP